MEYSFKGTIEFYGNHYFPGQVIYGTKIKVEDGHVFIFDDEENYVPGLGDLTRHEWAEVDKNTVEQFDYETENWIPLSREYLEENK